MALKIGGLTIPEILKKTLNENPHYLSEHNKSLDLIHKYAGGIWQTENKIYCGKTSSNIPFEKEQDVSEKISKLLHINLKIVSILSLSEYKNNQEIDANHNILIYELIPYEILNPLVNKEIYFDEEEYRWFKNKFIYTPYLNVRNNIENNIAYPPIGFIHKFIYAMTTNEDDFNYIINWLAFFFQNLKRLNRTIALIGKKEVSQNIFYEEIILPIFGKEFCLNINANVLKETNYDTNIASEKIFCNIHSLSHFSAKSQKTKCFINDIIYQKQTLFIFTNANNPILKEIKQQCLLIEINPLNKIIEKMDCSNDKEIYKEIEKDLLNFSKFLARIECNKH